MNVILALRVTLDGGDLVGLNNQVRLQLLHCPAGHFGGSLFGIADCNECCHNSLL
jgi:hypothetical protein